MKLKIFTMRFSESVDGFDDGPMQEFIADKEVIEYDEHFFNHDKTPYLTVLLSYRNFAPDERRRLNRRNDPRAELDDTEKDIFDALRVWRAARAKQDGMPPYMIANNKQLAKMVKLKAATKTDLGNVNGIGEAKIEKYGEDILRIIAEQQNPESADKTEKDEKDASA